MPTEITRTPCDAGRRLRHAAWKQPCPRLGVCMLVTDEGTLWFCEECFAFVTDLLDTPAP